MFVPPLFYVTWIDWLFNKKHAQSHIDYVYIYLHLIFHNMPSSYKYYSLSANTEIPLWNLTALQNYTPLFTPPDARTEATTITDGGSTLFTNTALHFLSKSDNVGGQLEMIYRHWNKQCLQSNRLSPNTNLRTRLTLVLTNPIQTQNKILLKLVICINCMKVAILPVNKLQSSQRRLYRSYNESDRACSNGNNALLLLIGSDSVPFGIYFSYYRAHIVKTTKQ